MSAPATTHAAALQRAQAMQHLAQQQRQEEEEMLSDDGPADSEPESALVSHLSADAPGHGHDVADSAASPAPHILAAGRATQKALAPRMGTMTSGSGQAHLSTAPTASRSPPARHRSLPAAVTVSWRWW